MTIDKSHAMLQPRRSVLLLLLAVSVMTRLAPFALARFGLPIDPDESAYPWNLSPLLPIGLFGGAVYADRRLAYAVPLATYVLGDAGVWALTGHLDWAVYAYQPVVYLSLAVVVWTGGLARSQYSWLRVATAGVMASAGFFLVTNFAVWALGGGVRYPLTGAGLVLCYVRALPYVRNTLLSMAVFLPVLFSPVGLGRRGAPLERMALQRS